MRGDLVEQFNYRLALRIVGLARSNPTACKRAPTERRDVPLQALIERAVVEAIETGQMYLYLIDAEREWQGGLQGGERRRKKIAHGKLADLALLLQLDEEFRDLVRVHQHIRP